MPVKTNEQALEEHICRQLANGNPCDPTAPPGAAAQRPPAPHWQPGAKADYNPHHAIDLPQLQAYLAATQPDIAADIPLNTPDHPKTQQFLTRLDTEIAKRGTHHVLQNGIAHHQHPHIALYHPTPNPHNRYTITRQLPYSPDHRKTLDIALFINGFPVITMEVKNPLTGQNARHAIAQYQTNRNPDDKLLTPRRCLAHFAVDDNQIHYCTHLAGPRSRFLPFNQGHQGGAGNPPNPNGLAADYLWCDILTPAGLSDILENYLIANPTTPDTPAVWPRYHQLDAVRYLAADAAQNGTGIRRLIQHSAGSGKSHTIAWLAQRLAEAKHRDKPLFDTILIVVDRTLLDKQLRRTMRDAAHMPSHIAHTDSAEQLARLIARHHKIIITTLQKFPHIQQTIAGADQTFAVIIDEAHSGQGGKSTTAMTQTLAPAAPANTDDHHLPEDGEDSEDEINRLLDQNIQNRRLPANAAYYAFTATPKNKTLELFGNQTESGEFKPHHLYTMKQAIDEGFIIDPLRHYTPVHRYYHLSQQTRENPKFAKNRALAALRRHVEKSDDAIGAKTQIMLTHFHDCIMARGKLAGKARAMLVTDGVKQAIDYYHEFTRRLRRTRSPHQAIIAFSGERRHNDRTVTESTLNGFPAARIEQKIAQDPYRFLICADKFQTGYDQPLIHTIYIDKKLAGVKAVQTISRANRPHPDKQDACILDFANAPQDIQDAFAPYHQATHLSAPSDPNRLHDLQNKLDAADIYTQQSVDNYVKNLLTGDDHQRYLTDPILDQSVHRYRQSPPAIQKQFKHDAAAYLRAYGFLSILLPFANREWEKRHIYLTHLSRKLPPLQDDDTPAGIAAMVSIDIYRAEQQAAEAIPLPDQSPAIAPLTAASPKNTYPPAQDTLAAIINTFNQRFGSFNLEYPTELKQQITHTIPRRLAREPEFRAAIQNNDTQNAQIQFNQSLHNHLPTLTDPATPAGAELLDQYYANPEFKRTMQNLIFQITRHIPPNPPHKV